MRLQPRSLGLCIAASLFVFSCAQTDSTDLNSSAEEVSAEEEIAQGDAEACRIAAQTKGHVERGGEGFSSAADRNDTITRIYEYFNLVGMSAARAETSEIRESGLRLIESAVGSDIRMPLLHLESLLVDCRAAGVEVSIPDVSATYPDRSAEDVICEVARGIDPQGNRASLESREFGSIHRVLSEENSFLDPSSPFANYLAEWRSTGTNRKMEIFTEIRDAC